ncbi:MAG: MoaD family protein [Candidatus Bathyarchaeota archaeon]|nr:MAG: MoaD family protein [Candidatus Bathyarchaeota archaeon]
MKVSIRLFTTLRELTGKGEHIIEFKGGGTTVESALRQLTTHYGKEFKTYLYNDKGKVQEYLQVLVNGRSIDLMEGFNTKLKDGDQLAIVPPIGGG